VPIVRFRAAGSGQPTVGWLDGDRIVPFAADSRLGTISGLLQLTAADLASLLAWERSGEEAIPAGDVEILAPIDQQEVWASGVTYRRSRDARMEESTQKDVYDQVYDAARPELFFKANPRRVSGPGEAVAIRSDSTWDVPEPELALVINVHREIVGYTVGNDMSSRSIEGENPLYLPQAKMYSASAALGPRIALTSEVADARNLKIELVIERDGAEHFRGETSTGQIHRTFDDLVSYLHRGNTFPDGVVLMTGTGIIPPDAFTLADGDVVHITIEGIGTLTNPVTRLDVGA
jgi:2-dehydro-3-deoxy-D-arabinonate dehydratase